LSSLSSPSSVSCCLHRHHCLRHCRLRVVCRHLYPHANACLIAPLSSSGWLSLSSCFCQFRCPYHDCQHCPRCLFVVTSSLSPS
jgi:hypothetical protein